MRIFQPPTFRHRAGFTLVELLVVLILIAIVGSAMFRQLNLNPRNNQLQDAVASIEAALIQARDISELRQLDIGMFYRDEMFIFQAFQMVGQEDGSTLAQWTDIAPSPVFTAQIELDPNIELAAKIEGTELDDISEFPDIPLLVLLPDGSTNADFALEMTLDSARAEILMDAYHAPEIIYVVQ